VRFLAVVLCCLVTLAVAVATLRASGDGGEYLLSARALLDHGTPAIREADAMWLSASEPRWRKLSARIAGGIQLGEPIPLPSVRRAPTGAYYSLHFWFYSLLAVPFLAVTEHFHLRPALALVVVNGLAAGTAIAFLFRRFGLGLVSLATASLYLLAGTTFYLGWTGPEVLTAAATLVTCLAARRGELGFAALAAGVAAAQNPSAVFLLPYAVWLSRPVRRSLSTWERRCAGAGVLLAVAPYVFFYYEFRVGSLIARFATDFALISRERAWSLVFDLNQGMIVGIPGVLIGVTGAIALALRAPGGSERRRVVANAGAALLVVVCMAVPTFSIHNWNSGSVVFMRYAYWLAMPLFELGLEVAASLPAAQRAVVAGVAAALQLGLLLPNGFAGENYNYLRHTWAATFVLEHWPGAYNPVPEIFYERTLGWEAPPNRHAVVVWPRRGTPGKAMVRADRPARSERVCPEGESFAGAREHTASAGWIFLEAPFRCDGR